MMTMNYAVFNNNSTSAVKYISIASWLQSWVTRMYVMYTASKSHNLNTVYFKLQNKAKQKQ